MLLFAVPTLDGVYKIAVFLVMLSVLVVLHEYGHFLLARRNGVRVNDFAVGFGPTLLKWTSPRSGTNYRVNILPLGGYCAMKGEDGKTSEAEQQREFRRGVEASSGPSALYADQGGVAVLERQQTDAMTAPIETIAVPAHDVDNFQAKRPLQRLAIVVAGPAANFIVTFALLFFVAAVYGIPNDHISTTVGPLRPGYPAERAGIHVGDTIVAIDGASMGDGTTLIHRIYGSLGKTLHISYVRGGSQHQVDVTPIAGEVDGKRVGLIGFSPEVGYRHVGIVAAAAAAGSQFAEIITSTVDSLVGLVRDFRHSASQMQGVIGLARVSGVVQDLGWAAYLKLAAMISLSLGVLNLIPFPALDGGRGAFIIAELLRGKPVDPEKEALIHVGGFAALMALMVIIAYHDVSNILSGKGVF